jgi:hypothetical protein
MLGATSSSNGIMQCSEQRFYPATTVKLSSLRSSCFYASSSRPGEALGLDSEVAVSCGFVTIYRANAEIF